MEGKKGNYWYIYLYGRDELKPWVDKVTKLKGQTKVLRIYFNNHYVGKAVVNAYHTMSMSQEDKNTLQQADSYLSKMHI